MKSFSFLLLGLILGCSTMFNTYAHEGERKKQRLAPEAEALLKARFPDLQITRIENVKRRGEKLQKVRLNGEQEVDDVLVTLSENVEILELDEDLELKRIPKHVLAVFRKAFPDTEVIHSEKATRMEIIYRFDIEKKGKKHEVSISRRGQISGVKNRD